MPRLANNMGIVLKSMNETYDTLTNKQAEFMMLDGMQTGWGLNFCEGLNWGNIMLWQESRDVEE